MNRLKQIFTVFLLLLLFAGCNYFTYTPRSKKKIHRERPSILLLEKIVEFRIEQLGWPTSKMDFVSKGEKYRKVFEGFPYNYTNFERIDSNKMIFSFTHHVKDEEKYNKTGRFDLNRFNGMVTFYKDNQKFAWKIRM